MVQAPNEISQPPILEMNAESFRQRAAASNKRAQDKAPATTITDNQNEGAT
jgi:hypothetical protein